MNGSKVHRVRDFKSLLKYALDNALVLTFLPLKNAKISLFHIEVFTDGSTGNKSDNYSREGYTIFWRSNDMTHPIFWQSRQILRIARSSSNAEISSAADAVDKSNYLRTLLSEIYSETQLACGTDSRSLYQPIPTNK